MDKTFDNINNNTKKKSLFKKFYIRKQIVITTSAKTLINQSIETVKTVLENDGFMNIKVISIYDVDYKNSYLANIVSKIWISGNETFNKGDQFKNSTPVYVWCHKKIIVRLSFTTSDNIGKVKTVLSDKGMINVVTKDLPDVGVGFFKKIGQIEKIFVDGLEFVPGMRVEYDTPIEVFYHTQKTTNPSQQQLNNLNKIKYQKKELRKKQFLKSLDRFCKSFDIGLLITWLVMTFVIKYCFSISEFNNTGWEFLFWLIYCFTVNLFIIESITNRDLAAAIMYLDVIAVIVVIFFLLLKMFYVF